MLETFLGQFLKKRMIHLFNILLGNQVSSHNATEIVFWNFSLLGVLAMDCL
jgi:hypothetical protein